MCSGVKCCGWKKDKDMAYVKGILSGFAAILIAEFVFITPFLRGSKGTGIAAFDAMLLESIFSPRFWIVAVLLFGLFFVASRGRTILRLLFFWIPTLAVSLAGLSIFALYAYLFTISRHR